MNLTILGCNSATPKRDRLPTAQLLKMHEQYFLLDCAEGTQIQLLRFNEKHSRINHIFISHLHGDHYFGLIGLLNTMALAGRTRTLHIYCPPALPALIQAHHFTDEYVQFPFEIEYTALIPETEQVLIDTSSVLVKAFPTSHSIPCHGFYFVEKQPPLRLLPEKCEAYNIPTAYFYSLKSGIDYTTPDGKIIPYTEVTIPNPAPVYSYAFSADTEFLPSISEAVKGVHTIYHESTYLSDRQDKAKLRKHSTALEAARIAALAQAQRLILGHFSSAYNDTQEFLVEAKTEFDNTFLAHDGAVFEFN